MLKINSLAYRQSMAKYIMDNTNTEGYIGYGEFENDPEVNDWFSTRQFLRKTFEIEALRHDNRYKAGRVTHKQMFSEWCTGLPSALDTRFVYNRSAIKDLQSVMELTDDEAARILKGDERKAEIRLIQQIYNMLYPVKGGEEA